MSEALREALERARPYVNSAAHCQMQQRVLAAVDAALSQQSPAPSPDPQWPDAMQFDKGTPSGYVVGFNDGVGKCIAAYRERAALASAAPSVEPAAVVVKDSTGPTKYIQFTTWGDDLPVGAKLYAAPPSAHEPEPVGAVITRVGTGGVPKRAPELYEQFKDLPNGTRLYVHPAVPDDEGLTDERAAFEAWADANQFCIHRDDTDKYRDYHRATTRFAWQAWQARAILAAGRGKP